MNKILATALASAGILGGGLALTLSPASAQEATPETDAGVTSEAPDADDAERTGRSHGRSGSRGISGEAVTDLLGMSSDELRTALSSGQSLADVAAAQGVSNDDLVATIVGSVQDRIDAAVESGRIDADAAAEKTADLEENIAEKLDEVRPTTEERAAAKAERQAERVADREALASLLGVTVEDMQAALSSGETLADIATANNVDPQTVIDALVADKQADIAAKVEAGDIDADRAAEKLESLEERITTKVNEGSDRGEGRRGKGRSGRSGRTAGTTDAGFRTGGATATELPAA